MSARPRLASSPSERSRSRGPASSRTPLRRGQSGIDDSASVASASTLATGGEAGTVLGRVQELVARCAPHEILLGKPKKADLYAARRFKDKTGDKGAQIKLKKLLETCSLAEELAVGSLARLREPFRSQKLHELHHMKGVQYPLAWCQTLIEAFVKQMGMYNNIHPDHLVGAMCDNK
jgi:hypothetical protein